VSAALAPDRDAAMVLALASTALPFAGSREAEAERWLRILRLHGEAGKVLQGLGVSEGALEAPEDSGGAPGQAGPAGEGRPHEDVLSAVSAEASRLAGERGAQAVSSADVLVGAMNVYGAAFDRVLRAHGTDREEVLVRVAIELRGAGAGTP
jgi:hypothetical protein